MGGRQQQVFGGDVLVLEIVRFLECALDELVKRSRHRRLRSALARYLWQALYFHVRVIENCLRPDPQLFEDGRNNAFLIFQQGRQQVHGQQLGIAVLGRDLIGALDGFLRLNREFVPTNSHK